MNFVLNASVNLALDIDLMTYVYVITNYTCFGIHLNTTIIISIYHCQYEFNLTEWLKRNRKTALLIWLIRFNIKIFDRLFKDPVWPGKPRMIWVIILYRSILSHPIQMQLFIFHQMLLIKIIVQYLQMLFNVLIFNS